MIGSSDGKQYETPFDVELGNHIVPDKEAVGASRKPAGALKQSTPTQGTPEPVIDREHDVPLAASALHKDGQMYGIAIDKDAPIRPEYNQYIYKHESDEFAYMKDLMTNGMKPTEAYHKAHDHITPMESARVQADLGEKGLEDYKQYWRDVTSASTQKENPNRHPDAHTTTFGLDEHELGKKFAEPARKLAGDVVKFPITDEKRKENTDFGKKLEELDPDAPKAPVVPLRRDAIFRGLKGAGITKTDAGFDQHLDDTGKMHPADVLNPMSSGSVGAPWFRGADGKRRQEIPDINAKLTPDKALQQSKTGRVTLGDILDHPALYKSYPQLKNVKMMGDDTIGLNGAYFNPSKNEIVVGPHESEEMLRSTLLHEVQHVVQDIEGFSSGASPQSMVPSVLRAMTMKGLTTDMEGLRHTAHDAYEHVAGEVESRNVETRRDFNEFQREFMPPKSTEDIPRSKQLNAPKESSSFKDPRSPWKQQEKDLITKRVDEGKHYSEIAKELGRSPSSVRSKIHDMDLDKPYTQMKWTPELSDKVSEMLSKGYKHSTIANELDLTEPQVKGFVRRSGQAGEHGKWRATNPEKYGSSPTMHQPSMPRLNLPPADESDPWLMEQLGYTK